MTTHNQSMQMRARIVALTCTAFALAACASDRAPLNPVDVPPKLSIIHGTGATDTIQARIFEAIVAEVRGADGKPVEGVEVRFNAPLATDPARKTEFSISLCNLLGNYCAQQQVAPREFVDTTDTDGHAETLVRLGSISGRVVVQVTAPSLTLTDSAVFNVTPGNAVRLRAFSADTSLKLGATITLGGRTFDRFNNLRTDVITATAGPGSVITASTSGVVSTVDIGEQWVFVRSGAFVDSTIVRAVPSARLIALDAQSQAVRMFDTDGSNKRTLVSNIWTSLGVYPHFEANRRQVMMYGTNISTTNFTLIDTTGTPRRDFLETFGFRAIQAVRLLADGTILVVSWGTTPGEYALFRVNTDNTVSRIRALPGLQADGGGHADIAPDGMRLAYQVYTGSPLGRELRVMNIETGAEIVVALYGQGPRWSPESDRLLFLTPQPYFDGVDGIATIINADGTGRRLVGSTIFSAGVAWSPDGKYIIGRGSVVPSRMLRIIRLSDLAGVNLQFRSANGTAEYYFQPDWR